MTILSKKFHGYSSELFYDTGAYIWVFRQDHYEGLDQTAIKINAESGNIGGSVKIYKNTIYNCHPPKYAAFEIKCDNCTLQYVTCDTITATNNPVYHMTTLHTQNTDHLAVFNIDCNAGDGFENKDVCTHLCYRQGEISDVNISNSIQTNIIANICGIWIQMQSKEANGNPVGNIERYIQFKCSGQYLTGAFHDSVNTLTNSICMNYAYFVNCTAGMEFIYTRPDSETSGTALLVLTNVRFIHCVGQTYLSTFLTDRLTKSIMTGCMIDQTPSDNQGLPFLETQNIPYPKMEMISIIPQTVTNEIVFTPCLLRLKLTLFVIYSVIDCTPS